MGDERRINQLTAKAYDNIGSSDYFAVDNASEAESKKLPASSIKTPISNLQGEVTGGSDTYSSTKNYSVGMYVTHTTGGVQKLYRCKTACTAASWTTNASCFEEANLADAVSALNNDLNVPKTPHTINDSILNVSTYTAPNSGFYFLVLAPASSTTVYARLEDSRNNLAVSACTTISGVASIYLIYLQKGITYNVFKSTSGIATLAIRQ